MLRKIGGGCSFCARSHCLLHQAGIQEDPCREVPRSALTWPCGELCLRLLEHGQGGSWGTPRCGAGARDCVWGTVCVSVPGALHTPPSPIPAGPSRVGKVSPFNAVSPCHSSLLALAASGMCLEESTVVVAFCLGSFSSGKKILLHYFCFCKNIQG